jgi:GR25 family glycosyltransferase involved in LPS biosynthesis
MKQITLFLIIIAIFFVFLIIYFFTKKKAEENKNIIKEELNYLMKEIDAYNKKQSQTKLITTPVYYINMDIHTDRRKHIERQLDKYATYKQRISGFNGYAIKNRQNDTVDGITFINDYKGMKNAEIGCTLSHLIAIKTAYYNGDAIAIIVEDDTNINLIEMMDENIESIIEKAPLNYDIIKLFYMDTNRANKLISYKNPLLKNYLFLYEQQGEEYSTYSTVGYLINRRGMKKILDYVMISESTFHIKKENDIPYYGSADIFIYNLANTYNLYPSIFFPNNVSLQSTIHEDHTSAHISRSIELLKYYSNKIKELEFKDNFSAYTYINFIKNYKNINTSNIIPKLMFRMSPFELSSIPNEIDTVLNNFFKLNPEYVQVYLDNNDCIQFITEYYPEYFEHYNNIIPGAYKSDICRLLLLYEFGGFYSDIGQTFKYPLSKFVDEDDEVVFCIENKPHTNIFNNSFMAFYPKHPILNYMIKNVIDNVSSKYYGIDKIDITGPRALGKSFNSFFNRSPTSNINTGKYKINNFKFNVFIADYPNNKIIDKKHNELAELKFPNYMNVMYKDKGKYYQNLWDKRKVYVNE